jgi:hypothetical protein
MLHFGGLQADGCSGLVTADLVLREGNCSSPTRQRVPLHRSFPDHAADRFRRRSLVTATAVPSGTRNIARPAALSIAPARLRPTGPDISWDNSCLGTNPLRRIPWDNSWEGRCSIDLHAPLLCCCCWACSLVPRRTNSCHLALRRRAASRGRTIRRRAPMISDCGRAGRLRSQGGPAIKP